MKKPVLACVLGLVMLGLAFPAAAQQMQQQRNRSMQQMHIQMSCVTTPDGAMICVIQPSGQQMMPMMNRSMMDGQHGMDRMPR